MEPNFLRGDAKAVIIDGADVGPKKLESNGTGNMVDLPRDRHVRINVGGWVGVERLEPADNGGSRFNRAKDWVGCGRL